MLRDSFNHFCKTKNGFCCVPVMDEKVTKITENFKKST